MLKAKNNLYMKDFCMRSKNMLFVIFLCIYPALSAAAMGSDEHEYLLKEKSKEEDAKIIMDSFDYKVPIAFDKSLIKQIVERNPSLINYIWTACLSHRTVPEGFCLLKACIYFAVKDDSKLPPLIDFLLDNGADINLSLTRDSVDGKIMTDTFITNFIRKHFAHRDVQIKLFHTFMQEWVDFEKKNSDGTTVDEALGRHLLDNQVALSEYERNPELHTMNHEYWRSNAQEVRDEITMLTYFQQSLRERKLAQEKVSQLFTPQNIAAFCSFNEPGIASLVLSYLGRRDMAELSTPRIDPPQGYRGVLLSFVSGRCSGYA